MIIKLTIPVEGNNYIITNSETILLVFVDTITHEVREFLDAVSKENVYAIVFTSTREIDTVLYKGTILYLEDYSFIEDIVEEPYQIRFVIGFGDEGKNIAIRFSQKNKGIVYLQDINSFKNIYKNLGNTVLIQMSEGIGDLLMTLPVARYYFKQGYKVDILTNLGYEEILNSINYINKVYTFEKNIDYSKYRLRYNPSGKLSNYDKEYCKQHRVFTIANLCGLDNDKVENDMLPDLVITEDEKVWAQRLLKGYSKTVALTLDSVHSKHRSLPPECQQDLINKLKVNGFNPIILHSKLQPYINCLNLSTKLSLRQFFAILAVSEYIVTVDTCTVQIAAALNKSIVLIPSIVNYKWRIYKEREVRLIKLNTDCYPCNEKYWNNSEDILCGQLLEEYPKCMKSINIDEIVQNLIK